MSDNPHRESARERFLEVLDTIEEAQINYSLVFKRTNPTPQDEMIIMVMTDEPIVPYFRRILGLPPLPAS